MSGRVALAFSGGLDTTYCAVWLREQGWEVHTVTVLTDTLSAGEATAFEARARALGVASHATLDARAELFDRHLRYLLFANALRGEVYPLCVSVERFVQARRVAEHALALRADALAHGSTGAGNDQVRFDVAFGVLAPRLKLLTPIREQGLNRDAEVQYLRERGVEVPAKTSRYSVNRGLWGATIGGAETHSGDGELPEDCWLMTAPPAQRPAESETLSVAFERGVPVAVDGRRGDPVGLIDELNARAGRHGVGRGVHVGDTILGIKGRVAFEAPAASVLIPAHRELEKLVLSRHQQTWKRTLGELYGCLLHEARFLDPVMRDLEAFLGSSQERVTGSVRVRLHQGRAWVCGAVSPHSLLDMRGARYGEGSGLWTGAEAAGFAKLYGMHERLLAQAGAAAEDAHAPSG